MYLSKVFSNRTERPGDAMTYDERVRRYEAEGVTRSDAQGIVDLEDIRAANGGDTMTHTPGQWTTKPGHRCTDLIYANREEVGYVKDANHAAFIVRACNAHEAMLEALRDLLEVAKSALQYADSVTVEDRAVINKAREALRLAEGGE